jgi:hypothetical protein
MRVPQSNHLPNVAPLKIIALEVRISITASGGDIHIHTRELLY